MLYLCTLFRVLREILCMHDGNIQMANEIKHTGTIIAIEGETVRVKIEPRTENLKIGDTVEVIIKQRMGWKAVVIAYIVPLIVLVGTLAVLDMRMESEALAGVIALGVTGVYFIVLRLFRDKLQREFSFSIRKTE